MARRSIDLLVADAAQVVTVNAGGKGPSRGRDAMNTLRVVEGASVAVHRGRVAAIGPSEALAEAFSPRERLDAEGCAVLPGFVDAHTHPVFATWLAAVFFTFIGLDAVSTAGDEVKNPQKSLPRALIIALFTVVAIYLFVAVAALGTQPWTKSSVAARSSGVASRVDSGIAVNRLRSRP